MRIIPNRLYKLRNERSLTRKALAETSGVSVRQIQRLENPKEASRNVRPANVMKLATALGVRPEELSGAPLTPRTKQTVRIGRALLPGVSLAYELIRRRYGVSVGEILNMAPLLFAMVAEQSLAWRSAELDRINEAAEAVWKLGSPRMRAALHAGNITNESGWEWEAVTKPDLFSDPFPADYDFAPDEDWDGNPFADYLRKLVEDLEPFWRELVEAGQRPGRIQLDRYDYTRATGSRVPDYSVCGDDLTAFAEPGTDALYALYAGDVRLSEIPEELLAEDAEPERQAWLEGRLSDKSKEWLDTLRSIAVKLPPPPLEYLDGDQEVSTGKPDAADREGPGAA